MSDHVTMTEAGRDYQASIGLEEGIKAGSAVATPYLQLLVGANLALQIELDATEPLAAPAAGAALMQRVAAASWVDYDQNAIFTGNLDNGKVFNRDNVEIFSFTVGVTASGSFYEFPSVAVVSGSPIRTNAPTLTIDSIYDNITLTTEGRNYSMSVGLEEGIKTGSTVTNPYLRLLVGANTALQIELDPTNPIDTPSVGVASMRRVGGAAWSAYEQNAVFTGDVDGCKVFNRDNEEIFSGSVGLTASSEFLRMDTVSVVSASPIVTSAPVLTFPITGP